jgi:hypothetical protein
MHTLVGAGVEVFMDDKDLGIGDDLLTKIEEGIDDSTGLLYVMSSHSVRSKWVKEELSLARVKQMSQKCFKIYPLMVEEVQLPLSIRRLKYADFRNWHIGEKYYSEVALLVESLGIKRRSMSSDAFHFVADHLDLFHSLVNGLRSFIGIIDANQGMYFHIYIAKEEGFHFNDVIKRAHKNSRELNLDPLLSELVDSIEAEKPPITPHLITKINEGLERYSNFTDLDGPDELLAAEAQFRGLAQDLELLYLTTIKELRVGVSTDGAGR